MTSRFERCVLAGATAVLAAASTLSPAVAAGRSPVGARLWVARYDGPSSWTDGARAVVLSPDAATIYVTGSSEGTNPPNRDYLTLAYDAASGSQLWEARYDGPGGDFDEPDAMALSSDGSVLVVTGETTSRQTWRDYATVAYDAGTGDQLWGVRYRGGANKDDDIPRAVVMSPNGSTVFVTGYSGGHNGNDVATIAYDAATGDRVWIRRLDGPDHLNDSSNAMAISSDGSALYIAGSVGVDGASDDYLMLALNPATGERLWVRTYDGPKSESDIVWGVGLSPDGSSLFVTGQSRGLSSADIATLAVDAADGSRKWLARYDGTGRADGANGLAVAPDGSKVYVVGDSVGQGEGGLNDYITVAYDAVSGARLWRQRYDGPGDSNDVASDIGLTPDGSQVWVTGSTYPPGGKSDYYTLSYDGATGDQLWANQFDGPSSSYDDPLALAVTADRAYVAGSSTSATYADYATIAYSI
jgi:putative pyrroloquinoline-quinone binding quinoprotein